MSELLDRITINPAVRSGKPVISGTRITVSDILEYLASGMSADEIIADFPDLSHEDILAQKLAETWGHETCETCRNLGSSLAL
jgi:uncharacterized protein (DUF433 family)